jgi:hypothetical protein
VRRGAANLTGESLRAHRLTRERSLVRDPSRAQRLYLSHRTISTQRYRIVPNLGIASRGRLASVPADRSRKRPRSRY